jgi:hypothetical protein
VTGNLGQLEVVITIVGVVWTAITSYVALTQRVILAEVQKNRELRETQIDALEKEIASIKESNNRDHDRIFQALARIEETKKVMDAR